MNPSSTEAASNNPANNSNGQNAAPNPAGQNGQDQTNSAPAGSSTNNSQSQLPNPNPNPNPNPPNQPPAKKPILTIIKSADVQLEVISIQQEENKGKTTWAQYQQYWKGVSKLIQLRAPSMQAINPETPNFHFKRVPCSYNSWIKTISALGRSFVAAGFLLFRLLI